MNSNEYHLRSFAKLRYLVGINDEISVFPPSIRLGCKSSGLKLRSNSFQSQTTPYVAIVESEF
ncbi:20586_t:CDS:2 [Funneliformis geosporum]|nr:20586_t:CDS:2 [Funneliformis geosporum]